MASSRHRSLFCDLSTAVSGMALPDKFWTENEYGVKGGIEGIYVDDNWTVKSRCSTRFRRQGRRL